MKDLEEMYTTAEVEERIDLICRYAMPGFRERVESGEYAPDELETGPKAIAVRNALARIETLKGEIRDGIRLENAELNPHRLT